MAHSMLNTYSRLELCLGVSFETYASVDNITFFHNQELFSISFQAIYTVKDEKLERVLR